MMKLDKIAIFVFTWNYYPSAFFLSLSFLMKIINILFFKLPFLEDSIEDSKNLFTNKKKNCFLFFFKKILNSPPFTRNNQ